MLVVCVSRPVCALWFYSHFGQCYNVMSMSWVTDRVCHVLYTFQCCSVMSFSWVTDSNYASEKSCKSQETKDTKYVFCYLLYTEEVSNIHKSEDSFFLTLPC